MKHLRLSIVLILVIFSTLIHASELVVGKVVGVHDGDTVTLLVDGHQQIKIRLAQIDAPEVAQAFGQRSQQSLSELVFNKTVQINKETTDKYGRTVGTIIVDGLDANKEQIKRGMAWVYRQYLHDQSLISIEEEAKSKKVGLWSDINAIPPWEFRHGSKRNSNASSEPRVAISPNNNLKKDSTCGTKKYCKEMASCEEAKFYLTQCGLSRLDGDSDGVPCEKLCGK